MKKKKKDKEKNKNNVSDFRTGESTISATI